MSNMEDFEKMLEESLGEQGALEGRVVTGTVVSVENDMVVIDVGLKAEGRVALKEFASPNQAEPVTLKSGDQVDVFVERLEDRNGETMLSREKAKREEAWVALEGLFEREERVLGTIVNRVKGGYAVDLNGATAFLPGSQVDIRPIRDIAPLMNISQPFQILKMDRARGNIVVSRRAILEETRAEQRAEIIQELKEGQTLNGIVKNITDYGAFVDLGGVDGLLHVTDISWRRISHPSEALEVGQQIDVQVIRFNSETQRISLGMKQLQPDPWDAVTSKYPIGGKFHGKVTNIIDYGAFVELENGVEGLVHVSEMSWTKKNLHPSKIVEPNQEVDVMVLDIDLVKRRISLGLKQCVANPWDSFLQEFPVGSTVTGEIRNVTEFGIFVGLTEDIDGMVHMSDIDWSQAPEAALANFNKGDQVTAKILDISLDKERVSLGIKQLQEPAPSATDGLGKGQVVTCVITKILDNGLEVSVNDTAVGMIKKSELSRDRSEQRPDRFAVDEKIDAKITQIDKAGKLTLSIKQREQAEEKEAMANYGSADSGASLGDILGAALKQRDDATKSDD
ncbi:MAG: 30S ribosomal protein S1 [Alphaproteobacteria bacterium]